MPKLMPEDPALKLSPRSTPAETETPTEAERLTARIGLLDGPIPTPPRTPIPGLRVAVASMHPFRMFPPLSHVPVAGLLNDVGIVTRAPRLEVGIRLLTMPVKPVGMLREGSPTPASTPTDTDAATVAETLTPSGMLGTSEASPGRAENSDEALSNTAPGT